MLAAISKLAGAATATPEPTAQVEPKPQDSAERRQVTVMFSDLVGSTALSARMDAEDLREVISAYQKCVAETVQRFGGFVAKYMGDGALVYFGYPQAHEDVMKVSVGYPKSPLNGSVLSGGPKPGARVVPVAGQTPLGSGTSPRFVLFVGTGGYAITLQFPPFDKVTDVTAKLTDAKGDLVKFFLSDPEHPATSFGQFGLICLIPKLSLHAQHAYTVRIDATWNGKPGTWTWSFSTVSLRGIEASDDRAVAGAINVPSLVRGTVAYGGMRNVETVALQLAAGEGSRYKMLSVIIPTAVWRQIAGSAEPGSFKGKIIEVQTTPQVVKGNT
jgi:class 3 adenylate cyclase